MSTNRLRLAAAIAVAAVLIASAGAVLGKTKEVAGTKHDVSSPGVSPCTYCHVPRDTQGALLWARSPNDVGRFSGLKTLCFSCHDGTVTTVGTYAFDAGRLLREERSAWYQTGFFGEVAGGDDGNLPGLGPRCGFVPELECCSLTAEDGDDAEADWRRDRKAVEQLGICRACVSMRDGGILIQEGEVAGNDWGTWVREPVCR